MPPCGPHYAAGLHIFDHENAPLAESLFAPVDFAVFQKDPFSFDGCSDKAVPGMGTDLPMSAFLSTLPAF